MPAGMRLCIEDHNLALLLAEYRPHRQCSTVRIARPGEARPIRRHHGRRRMIGIDQRPIEKLQIIISLAYFTAMKGAVYIRTTKLRNLTVKEI